MGESPHDHKSWVFKQLGEPRYDDLVLRANSVCKRTKAERKEMLEHFKAQLEYLKRRRREGEIGVIEFTEWD